jgi:hypothetical protein
MRARISLHEIDPSMVVVDEKHAVPGARVRRKAFGLEQE